MKLLEIFKQTNALLEGHFVLSSGLHSEKYLQCALILQYPDYAEKLCKELAKKIKKKHKKIDLVISPALGGVVIGYELARILGVRSIFAERKEGQMQLRRNFAIKKGEKAIVCEDVITTGGSTKEVMDIVASLGGETIAVASMVDRSGKEDVFGKIPLFSLYKINIKTYQPQDCPLCKKGIPVNKPGSKQQ